MADEADIANAYIARAIELELHKRQQGVAVKKGAKFCKDCGATMPSVRRESGFQLCRECAEQAERREAQYASN